jgi:uncharacterized protein (TIGR02246 family)
LLAMASGPQATQTTPPTMTPPTQSTSAMQPATTDPALQKLADDYTSAWAKGDAAGIAALYTPDALYIDLQNKVMKGQSEIAAGFKMLFDGMLKGTTITIQPGEMRQVAADVMVGEGTWTIAGGATTPAATATTSTAAAVKPSGAGSGPTSGRYLNTLVRQQGRWTIAATAVVPEPTGATGPTR